MGEFVTFVILLLEVVSFVYTNDAFFEIKNKKTLHIGIIVAIAVKGFSLLDVMGATAFSMITGFAILLGLSIVCYSGSVLKKITLTIIFLAVAYSIDALVAIVNTTIFDKTFIELILDQNLYISSTIIAKFSLLLITYILRRKFISKRNNTQISFFQWAISFAFSGYTFFTIYISMTEAVKYGDSNLVTIFNNVAVILCNLLLFYMIDQLEEENEFKRRTSVLQQQIRIEMQGYTELSSAYENQRRLTHDFNNHLSIIQSLISNDAVMEAERYINKVIGDTSKNQIMFNTNNPIIDALLTQKYFLAKRKNVDMQIMTSDLANVPMKTEDILIVLFNAIDNAIEAAMKCRDKKVVRIKISKEEEELVFSVQNTTIINPKEINFDLSTTKSDKVNHGFGLKIIREVLLKYDINYSLSAYDGWFRFSFLVNI